MDTLVAAPIVSPAAPGTAFERLGGIARELGQAIAQLDAAAGLQRLVEQIPDARERLAYVGQMTENAAHRVLGLVEEAKPACDEMALHSRQIAESFERRLNEPADPAQARRMLIACNGFARRSAEFADSQAQVLGQIMLSQDFQDLSGQVIKKVLDVITRTEQQLVAVLRDCAPEVLAAPKPEAAAELDGPQVPDKAMGQNDVDDLLASLGF